MKIKLYKNKKDKTICTFEDYLLWQISIIIIRLPRPWIISHVCFTGYSLAPGIVVSPISQDSDLQQ